MKSAREKIEARRDQFLKVCAEMGHGNRPECRRYVDGLNEALSCFPQPKRKPKKRPGVKTK